MFRFFSMLLLCSFFRLPLKNYLKWKMVLSFLFFFRKMPNIWVGRTTLKGEKNEDGLRPIRDPLSSLFVDNIVVILLILFTIDHVHERIHTSYVYSFNKLFQVVYLKAYKCYKRDWEGYKSLFTERKEPKQWFLSFCWLYLASCPPFLKVSDNTLLSISYHCGSCRLVVIDRNVPVITPLTKCCSFWFFKKITAVEIAREKAQLNWQLIYMINFHWKHFHLPALSR